MAEGKTAEVIEGHLLYGQHSSTELRDALALCDTLNRDRRELEASDPEGRDIEKAVYVNVQWRGEYITALAFNADG